VIVTRKGMATSSTNLRPKDVNREFVMMFGVINENENYFLQENVDSFLNGVTPENADEFEESNLMHAINGYLYCHRDSA
jgi:manganese oxidase